MVAIKASFGDKSESKGNNRKAPCGPVMGTEVSAKKFFTFLGQNSPKDKAMDIGELIRLGKAVGLTVITEKTESCGKGCVKRDTVRQWYKWGHPGYRDEKPGKPAKPVVLPKVILDKIT